MIWQKRNESLFHAAYLLADAGYDVWMGNARGNMYSTKHDKVSPMLPTFWSFRYVKTQLNWEDNKPPLVESEVDAFTLPRCYAA